MKKRVLYIKVAYKKIKDVVTNRHVQMAFVLAFLLLIFGYFTNNWSLFTGENMNSHMKREILKNLFGNEKEDFSGVLFVNTSFDKQLIDVYEDGYLVGKTAITDRRKLLEFLKLLEHTDYEYVVIDISFDQDLASQDTLIDKELFAQIKSMERCVVATTHGIHLLEGLESKAALADFKSTVAATNFVRYKYFDSIPSVPLRVYNDMRKSRGLDTIDYSHSLNNWGFYREGRRLCHNSLFLEFSSKGIPQLKENTELLGLSFAADYNYRNLGSNYVNHLDGMPESEVLDMIEGDLKTSAKNGERTIVFIGNLVEDLHDTYAGKQPGVLIIFKAIQALQEGRHLVSMLHAVLLFFVYFFVCLFIQEDKSLVNLIFREWMDKHRFFAFLLQMCSLSIVLFLIKVIDIELFKVTTNFILSDVLFYMLKLYVNFKKIQKNEKTSEPVPVVPAD